MTFAVLVSFAEIEYGGSPELSKRKSPLPVGVSGKAHHPEIVAADFSLEQNAGH